MSFVVRGRSVSISASFALAGSLVCLSTTLNVTLNNRPIFPIIFVQQYAPEAPAPVVSSAPPAPWRAHAPSPLPIMPDAFDPPPLSSAPSAPIPNLPAPPPAGAPLIANPRWLYRPTPEDMADLYPQQALYAAPEGRVTLDCLVRLGGHLACKAIEEIPAQHGFAAAALEASRLFKAAPLTGDGAASAGGRVILPITFQAPHD